MINTSHCKFLLGIGIFLAMLAVAMAPAHARNVPGSASAVQSRIDQAVASSIIDTTLMSARDAALFDLCQGYLKENPENAVLRSPCEWGISGGFGLRRVEGDPNGFGFDFTSAFGNIAVARAISPTTSLIAAIIAEQGSGDLDYNHGTLKNNGVGALGGVTIKLNDRLDFSILGGAEWLSYRTTRTFGLYQGEYDALRYIIDAQLRGTSDVGNYFLEYGAGLRYIHQENDPYVEYSSGMPFANVPGSGFSTLTGIGDLKFGTRLPGFRPYLQTTGYLNFLENRDFAASFGTLTPYGQDVSGRFGVGADIDMLAGKLSLSAGIFVDKDGFQGADGGFKFSKAF